MKYLLDTDALTFLCDNQRAEHEIFMGRLEQLADEDVLFFSVLSVFELEYSFANVTDKMKAKKIRATIQTILKNPNLFSLPIKAEMAQWYGKVKRILKQKENISRENIKKFNIDMMLASVAIHEDCTLVSGDNIYQRIARHQTELKTECWW